MGNLTLILLSLLAGAGVLMNAPEKLKNIYDEAIESGQYLATAGDLRSISNMLDYEYMRRGRYPKEDHFALWMVKTFKENHIKDLLQDHWGNTYIYHAGARQELFVLISMGPDGLPGTEDDLKVTGP